MESNKVINITIFHTNDMHGRLQEIARLSNFARRHRDEVQAEGRRVFFWDAGDAADRRLQLCSITKGAAFSQILNAMGYSLQTMGNAISLPYGPQTMKTVAHRVNFPILAANCRDGDGPLIDGLQEYEIFPITNKVKIGVLGLTAPWGGIYEIFGLHFPDFYELAEKKIQELHQKGASLIVVLSHLGLEDDRRLAETVPGIDLIIGGHSHDRLPTGEVHNGVLIAQAGDYAQFLGRVDLTIDADTSQVLSLTAQLLEVPAGETPDQAVLDAITVAEAEAEDIMSQSIGTLKVELNLDHYTECGIGNLATDGLKERMGADAAIIASGQFHTGLPAGTISLGQLDKACFSSANPGLTEVKGIQIL
ncbi:MAG: bifunctional metallophosphatase/5'-nucleotidase, partial [Anaerolineales bacterium]|nr:bifunctional metallophosphatase/5'-nucleotidase [Anaerolineales bacterium]